MFKLTKMISCTCVLLGMIACTKPASQPNAPATAATPAATRNAAVTSLNFVKASVAPVQLSGESVEATVTVKVQSGYHVNANPASDSYLKATELILQAADGLSIGFIKYPSAINKKFSFSDKQLAVYEGEVPVKVMLKAAPAASKGTHNLNAKLNVQACDDQLCYPPGTMELTIPVEIK